MFASSSASWTFSPCASSTPTSDSPLPISTVERLDLDLLGQRDDLGRERRGARPRTHAQQPIGVDLIPELAEECRRASA